MLLSSSDSRGSIQMPVSGASVLTWGHRALTSVVETGSRLLARAAISGCDRRRVERRSAEPPAPAVSSPAPPQPPTPPPPTVAGRPESATTSEAQPRRSVPARATAPSVTPAMVRRWAHEQGIQVADRGRIPQSLMASTWHRWHGQRQEAAGPAEPPPRAHAARPAAPAPLQPDDPLAARHSSRSHKRPWCQG